MTIFDREKFEAAVEHRFQKARERYSVDHDDQHGLDHLLSVAMDYLSQAKVLDAAVLISAAQAYRARHAEDQDTDYMQEGINQFMSLAGQKVYDHPTKPGPEVVALRKELIYEEVMGIGELFDSMDKGDLVGIADGIADVLYVVIGTASAYGINIRPFFAEVQRSNMTKFTWNEETQSYDVIFSETGKVLKPETFSPADLKSVMELEVAKGRREEIEEDVIVAELVEEDSVDHGGWEDR